LDANSSRGVTIAR